MTHDSDGETAPHGESFGREPRPVDTRADREHPGIVVSPEMADERRSKSIRRLLMGAALVVTAVGGYYVWGGDVVEWIGRPQGAMAGQAGDQIESIFGSSAGQEDGPLTSGDSSVDDSAPAEGASAGTSVDPAVATFRARAEELMTAAARFGERSQDFRLGRIGCSALAEGYLAVDRAMVDMAGSFLDAGSRPGPEERELYRRAMDRADSIARSFDRSGCDRDF